MTVMLAVPTRGDVAHQTAEAVFALAARLGTAPLFQVGHLSAGATRNLIVAGFLATGHDVLFMVDDDVLPPTRAAELVEGLDRGWDVLAAAVPIFQPARWPAPVIAAYTRDGRGDYYLARPTRLGERIVRCDAVGTGCVAITRRILRTIDAPFGERMDYDAAGRARVVSDDASFCQRVREIGGRIGCDFQIACDHLARVSLASIMRVVPESGVAGKA